MNFLESVVNNGALKKLNNIVKKISTHEIYISKLSNGQICEKYKTVKENFLHDSTCDLSFLLALIKEAFARTLKVTPYNEQFTCALALYFGYITEMKTGEGKSIVAVIAAILSNLKGRVHIATVNDYLAKRDYEFMKPVFDLFEIKTGANEREYANKVELYQSDVVYSSSMDLIFDYLRNELLPVNEQMVFPLDTVIIDEIDFVLLDNANSIFSISTGLNYMPFVDEFKLAKELCKGLVGEERGKEDYVEDIPESDDVHYIYYVHNRTTYLTDRGISLIEKILDINNLLSKNLSLYKAIIYTLEANLFYKNGKDYIIKDNKIVLISQANGRLLPDSHLEGELHTAIEVKEGVPVTEKHLLCNSLSYQIFFTKYKMMVGMSGTIYDSRQEFEELFKVPTIYIPTHKPNNRIDYHDLIFKTKKDKYDYLIEMVTTLKKVGQPVLIITGSEQESLVVQELFTTRSIVQTSLLNAQNTDDEAKLIKAAGIHDAITISTNISGRGTDIVLDEIAKKSGGLFVIILNRNISKRIDNQARGRAGRQGEPGECICLVSLEDELLKHAVLEHKQKLEEIQDKDFVLLTPEVSKKVEKVLNAIQSHTQCNLFKVRQMLFGLDGIVEDRRKIVFEWKDILNNSSGKEVLLKYISSSEFDKNKFLKIWNESVSDNTLEIDNLKQYINDQYNSIGEDVCELLIRQLIEQLFHKEWLIFKRDMEYLKNYLHLYRVSEDETIRKYAGICTSQFEVFRQNVMNNLLGYFLSAKIDSVVQKN